MAVHFIACIISLAQARPKQYDSTTCGRMLQYTHVTLGGSRGKQVMALCIEGWDFMQTLGEGAYGE